MLHTIELIGSTIARYDDGTEVDARPGKRNTSKSPIPPLCRKLVEEGHDPSTSVRIVRKALNGTGRKSAGLISVFRRDRTLAEWAGVDMVESDAKPLHVVKYSPYSSRVSP